MHWLREEGKGNNKNDIAGILLVLFLIYLKFHGSYKFISSNATFLRIISWRNLDLNFLQSHIFKEENIIGGNTICTNQFKKR
jgi:hypothetical protein